MKAILIPVLFVVMLPIIALTWAVTVRYMVRRREEAGELARMGFNLDAFFEASLPPVDDGANMRTTKGFVATTNKGKVDSIRQTRTISREL